jgi:hypothetical protein
LFAGSAMTSRDIRRTVSMQLDEQYEQTRHSLRRTKPRSKRRTIIERNLVHIQIKRIKRELKGKAK